MSKFDGAKLLKNFVISRSKFSPRKNKKDHHESKICKRRSFGCEEPRQSSQRNTIKEDRQSGDGWAKWVGTVGQ